MVQPFGVGTGYRFEQHDDYVLRTLSVSGVKVRAELFLLYDNGRSGQSAVEVVTSSTRTIVSSTGPQFPSGGWVIGAFVQALNGDQERGKTYCTLRLGRPPATRKQALCSGNAGVEGPLSLGMFEQAFSGRGDTEPESIGTDIAGTVDTTHDMSLDNSIRRVDGYVFYYHCSADVADRTSQLRLRSPGPSVPTGFDSGNDRQIYNVTGPTLSANQDGVVYVNNAGYQVAVDDNVITTANNTTAPTPFPLWVHGADLMDLNFDITLGEALDTYGGFIFGEIWFE